MLKYLLFTFVFTLLISGCSAKGINDGVDSITSDITNAFENSRDKSVD